MKVPVLESLFGKVVLGLRPVTLLKKETLTQVFSCEFCEISKSTVFTEHLRVTASVNSDMYSRFAFIFTVRLISTSFYLLQKIIRSSRPEVFCYAH